MNHRIENNKEGRACWNCTCDCGNSLDTLGKRLLNGTTQSCGCYRKENTAKLNFIDLTGKRFGKLTVLYDTNKKRAGHTLWHSICDCGNHVDAQSSDLIGGKTISCGCQSESIIASGIKKYFVERYNSETEYKIFKNPKTNRFLPYDIYVHQGKNREINGIYIEINGIQHYRLNTWHYALSKKNGTTPEIELEYQKTRDSLKIEFARKNGTYIEIDLRDTESLEQAIKHIEKYLENIS